MLRASLVPLALAFLTGIASGLRGFAVPVLGATLLLARFARVPGADLRAAIVTALALGAFLAQVRGSPSFAPEDSRSHLYEGVVVERTGALEAGEFVLRLDDGRHVTTLIAHTALEIGSRVRAYARYEPPGDARNEGEASPRELASERGLAGRLERAHVISVSATDSRDASLWIPRLRAWGGARLRERLDEPYATILAGALWGERGALPPDLRGEFQDTGTVHILVTAGLHLGVIAALAIGAIALCGGGRIGSSLGAIAIVWLYAVFSGAHLPSIRAATMLSFGLLARATGRSALSWNALAAAAIVVAALRPDSVTSLSFALSFSCVGAILLFAEPFASALERFGLPEPAREALALTFATQAGTWPLTAFAFLVIAPYASLANAFVVPAVGVAMLIGLLELAATPIPLVAQALANVETSVLMWIVGVVRFTASLPGAHVVATPPPMWAIACYDLALGGAAALLARRRRLSAAILVAAAIALCAWPPRPISRDLVITAIDVGQADAILIRTPDGHAYLVDAGGRLERGRSLVTGSPAEAIGERIVVPFLVRQGIHHLDGVLLSHPHGDHAGGLPPVLRTLGADAFADSGQEYGGFAYRDALGVARDKHTPTIYPRAGSVWKTSDGVTLTFLGPQEPFITGSRNDINNNSLVFMLQYKAFRMLFTGDAGSEAEQRILHAGADLHADVLKVGHHGSAYSSTHAFIDAVHPKYAIISVGRNNLFGHPAPQTLETLKAAGAALYRTDENGAVTIETDGQVIRVRSSLRSSSG
jgi:competence protein ComEC